jgi:hypothetical protein
LTRGRGKYRAQSIEDGWRFFIIGGSQRELLNGQIVVMVIVLTLGVYLSELEVSGEVDTVLWRGFLDGVACSFSFSPITPDPFSVTPRDSCPPPQ